MLPVPSIHHPSQKNICYIFLFSRKEWLFAPTNMTVSSRVWLSEKENLRKVLVNGSFFHEVLPFFVSAKDGC